MRASLAADLTHAVPVTSDTFNFAPAVFAGITALAIISYFITPESAWLPPSQLAQMHHAVEDAAKTD